MRRVRLRLRVVAGHCVDDGCRGVAGIAPLPVLGRLGHGNSGRGRCAGHSDSALDRSGDLRHHRRGQHHHDVHCRVAAGHPRGDPVPRHDRGVRDGLPQIRTERPRRRPRRVRRGNAARGADPGDFRPGHGRHLLRSVRSDAGRRGGCRSGGLLRCGPRGREAARVEVVAVGDGTHDRHDLPDPARCRNAEDLHGARRRASGDGHVDGQLRSVGDDGPGDPAGRADPARVPDGQPVDDSAGDSVFLAGADRSQRRRQRQRRGRLALLVTFPAITLWLPKFLAG